MRGPGYRATKMQFIRCAEIVQMIEGNTSQPQLVRRRKASRGPRTMARAEALHRDLRGLKIAPQSSGAATFKEESLSV